MYVYLTDEWWDISGRWTKGKNYSLKCKKGKFLSVAPRPAENCCAHLLPRVPLSVQFAHDMDDTYSSFVCMFMLNTAALTA